MVEWSMILDAEGWSSNSSSDASRLVPWARMVCMSALDGGDVTCAKLDTALAVLGFDT